MLNFPNTLTASHLELDLIVNDFTLKYIAPRCQHTCCRKYDLKIVIKYKYVILKYYSCLLLKNFIISHQRVIRTTYEIFRQMPNYTLVRDMQKVNQN